MKQIFREALLVSLLVAGGTSFTCATAIATEVSVNTKAAQLQNVQGQQAVAPATTVEPSVLNRRDSTTKNLANYQTGTIFVAQSSRNSDRDGTKVEPMTQPEAEPGVDDPDPKQPLAQVNSVSQLSDVQPTDWAFQALQSLVERYGCIAGYPNGTFRGNRAMTRYEFAAGLNACLDRVNELIAAGTSDLVRKEDIATLQRLQQEFGAELTAVRGRVDNLEAQTAQLEANQFSTTTKLTGQVIFDLNGGTSTSRRVRDPNIVFISRARLNFTTSFTGKDQLFTQLQFGSNTSETNTSPDNAGAYFAGLGTFSGLDYAFGTPSVSLRRLRYNFPVGKDLQVSIFPRANIGDYVDLNSYANDSASDFSASWAVNDYLVLGGDPTGAGLALTYNPNQGPVTITAAYRATSGSTPTSQGRFRNGEFGDPYLSAAEIAFAPTKSFTGRVLYTYGSDGGNRFSGIGFNFEYAIVKKFAIFGRFGHVFDYAPSAIVSGFDDPGFISNSVITNRAKPNYWMAGFALPDLFITGALAGVAVGEPFIDNSIGNGTEKNLEAFYRYPINDHITITPSFQVIVSPGNAISQGTDYIGSLRTVFRF